MNVELSLVMMIAALILVLLICVIVIISIVSSMHRRMLASFTMLSSWELAIKAGTAAGEPVSGPTVGLVREMGKAMENTGIACGDHGTKKSRAADKQAAQTIKEIKEKNARTGLRVSTSI